MKLLRSPQFRALFWLVFLYALAAVLFIYTPGSNQAMLDAIGENAGPQLPRWQLALANCLLIFVVYLPLGTLGLWLARRGGLPGIYKPGDSPRQWAVQPCLIGVGVGLVLVALDQAAQRLGYGTGFPHPPFPASILASLTAGIGEEILFRLFLMSLWVVIFGWLFRRVLSPSRAQSAALIAANLLAALAFGASHLATVMVLTGAASPLELPLWMLGQVFLLNGILGVTAGMLFARRGAIAAMGVHFWADMVWHVLYGLIG